MFLPFLIGAAIHQDAVTLKFVPKVGEKYRYATTMTDEDGTNLIPAETKVFTVFKVAGEKDGLYTMHQSSEIKDVEPRLVLTIKVNSSLIGPVIGSDQPTEEALAGAIMAGRVIGIFGVQFDSKPVKAGDTWTSSIDPKSIAKDFVLGTTHDETAKIESDGSINYTLDKLDETTATVHSVIHFSMSTQVEDNGQVHKLAMSMDVDQVTKIDRASGIPTGFDRTIKMKNKMDSDTTTSTKVLHLVRI